MSSSRDVGAAGHLDRSDSAGLDRSEPLFDSSLTRVLRVWYAHAGEPVLRKEAIGPRGEQRLRHELRIMERLAGVPGVPRSVGTDRRGSAILLEDPSDGGQLLAAMGAVPMAPDELVRIARELAMVLAGIHERGVVYKDLTPDNVLLVGPDRRVALMGYELATTSAEERPGFVHEQEIVGSLAYMAPELTGRTGLPVDQRTDLYALGATLYALATGGPPFGTGDPLRLVHDHLARVPVPPVVVNAVVPVGFSDVVMRLLEKEPGRRYQSAAGVAYDLGQVAEALAAGDETTRIVLGKRDFPARLVAPSRLVGRDEEIAVLSAALAEATTVPGTAGRNVFVVGPPGVGKTVLIDELRPMVAAAGGWFVSGKCDQFRSDLASDPVHQCLSALFRLLLAEPEDRLDVVRDRLHAEVGAGLGVLAAMNPLLTRLIGPAPGGDTEDPWQYPERLHQAGVAMLRAVVSPRRPLVMFLDDLQWADEGPLGLVNALLTSGGVPGLLLVGAYRDAETGEGGRLQPMLARWRRLGVMPTVIELRNLPSPGLSALLGEMLRLPSGEAARLAEAVGQRTAGNPYDTVELINALRHEGVLVAGESGWNWAPGQIRRFVGRGDVADLLTARIGRLPIASRDLIAVIACLGGQVSLTLLQSAVELSPAALAERLQPALEEGLLVEATVLELTDPSPEMLSTRMPAIGQSEPGLGPGADAIRFRHDRVQQVAYRRLDPEVRKRLHLTLARRLARLTEFRIEAAQQYLQAVPVLQPGEERRRAVALFAEAAEKSQIANITTAERFLTTAIRLLDEEAGGEQAGGEEAGSAEAGDQAAIASLRGVLDERLHAVLYRLGRHDEVDVVFERIIARTTDPAELIDPVCVQATSLAVRGEPQRALDLGVDLLDRMGLRRPDELDELNALIAEMLGELRSWAAEADMSQELRRPETRDRRVLGLAKLIKTLVNPSFFVDPLIDAWLKLESHRLWAEYGPCPDLLVNVAAAAALPVQMGGDYRTCYLLSRKVLMLTEAYGYKEYEPWARFLFTGWGQHWFEPLEDLIEQGRMAHEGLLRGGQLQQAAFAFGASMYPLLDCGPTVDDLLEYAEAAIAFSARTAEENVGVIWLWYRQLARSLRGETAVPGGLTDADFDEAAMTEALASAPLVFGLCAGGRAVTAAIFGDDQALDRFSKAAMDAEPFTAAFPTAIWAHTLRALSVAERLQAMADDAAETPALLEELDGCREWLARRAADAPVNFSHLVGWIDAERAWALGDFVAASRAFDAARREVSGRARPWQRALITERAGRLQTAYGMDFLGLSLLSAAQRGFRSWGAWGKAEALDLEFPGLSTLSSAWEFEVVHAGGATPAPGAVEHDRGFPPASPGRGAGAGPEPVAAPGSMPGLSAASNVEPAAGAVADSVRESAPAAAAAAAAAAEPELGLSSERIDLMAVLRASQALSSETELQGLHARVVGVLGAMTGATGVRMLVADPERGGWFVPDEEPEPAAADRPEAQDGSVMTLEEAGELGLVPTSAVRYVGRTGELLVVDDACTDERFARDRFFAGVEQCSLLVVPIVSQGLTRAMLVLDNRLSRGAFSADRLDAVVLVAGQLAVSLENALLYRSLEQKVAQRTTELEAANEQLELMSVTDPLTGLANRRRLARELDAAWHRAIPTGAPVALMMIDIDHFKTYNDRYGHLAGDTCLRRVAAAVSATVRDTDLVARYGGEEFAVMMPGTDVFMAMTLGEQIRTAVERLREPHSGSRHGVLTVSIGVTAEVPTARMHARQLIDAADVQLYRAKHTGRNRVMGDDAGATGG